MLSARCKVCNRELVATSKLQVCGCPNSMEVKEDKITAVDLSKVVLLNSGKNLKKHTVLSDSDLRYQEARRQRRVRKLDFEER